MAHYQIPNGTAFCTIVRTVSLSNVTVSPCEKGCCELCCKNLVRELPSVAYLRTGRPNFDCAPMFLQKMKSHNARFTCLWSLRISGHLHRLLANVQPMLPFNITNGCAVPASFATRSVLIYSFQLVVSWIGRKTGRRWGTIPKEHGQCGWEKAPNNTEYALVRPCWLAHCCLDHAGAPRKVMKCYSRCATNSIDHARFNIVICMSCRIIVFCELNIHLFFLFYP